MEGNIAVLPVEIESRTFDCRIGYGKNTAFGYDGRRIDIYTESYSIVFSMPTDTVRLIECTVIDMDISTYSAEMQCRT